MTKNSTALIVGASRGLGLGLSRELLGRGWNVIATERKADANTALKALVRENPTLRVEQLDVERLADIVALAGRLGDVALDLLFVNAGVSNDPSQLITQVSKEDFCHLMVVNAYCPFQVIEQLEAKVKPAGTIAVMSSSLGSIGGNTEGGHEAYRASKAALNSLMRSYAARASIQRTLLLMMPGWVKTEMGGSNAPLDVETSVRGLADTLARRQGKPGLSFVDYLDETLPW